MAQRLRTFILYSEDGVVKPMSLLRRRNVPRIPNVRYLEISSDICCGGTIMPVISGGTSKLKAFVLLGKNGQVLGGPIIRKNKPKNGKYVQIPYNICCDSFASLPEITTQPLPLTIPLGDDSQQLTVVATGTGTLTYQWYKDGVAIAPGTLYINGQTTDTLTISPNSITLTGEYYVIVTDDIGSIQSNTVQVTVE